jgi:hypothetical protein
VNFKDTIIICKMRDGSDKFVTWDGSLSDNRDNAHAWTSERARELIAVAQKRIDGGDHHGAMYCVPGFST